MNKLLNKIDSNVAELKNSSGTVYVSCGLQGRIFCAIGDEIIHKVDVELANNPHQNKFNNIGGNSLWPAPEGGAFAFNYPPDSESWLVQPAINLQCPTLDPESNSAKIVIRKKISLQNRQGVTQNLKFSREVELVDLTDFEQKYSVKAIGYHSVDSLIMDTPSEVSNWAISAWSLEQFSGAEGIIAFGKIDHGDSKEAVNGDFYGNPWPRLKFYDSIFVFALGGKDKLQIGINSTFNPQFIGAWDKKRNFLMIRKTPKINVNDHLRYINIADNDQPCGIFGASDMYSIFNGATADFFELETIAPMCLNENNQVTGSVLESESYFFSGDANSIAQLLQKEYNIPMEALA